MDEFVQLRVAVDEAEAALRKAVRAACPGVHRPIQHRDRKPAWRPGE